MAPLGGVERARVPVQVSAASLNCDTSSRCRRCRADAVLLDLEVELDGQVRRTEVFPREPAPAL